MIQTPTCMSCIMSYSLLAAVPWNGLKHSRQKARLCIRAIPHYGHYIQRANFWKKISFLHTSLKQFLFKICTNIHYMVLNCQHKRNFNFVYKSCQYFCFTLCYGHCKKINLQFYMFKLTVLFLWINMWDITIIRIWLLHSFIKSNCFP